ncbi:MAG TPA: sulfotransferase [Solirubrobacteraceae bacterium]|nr:sulfotransferase [Solirubrobacteraceae bacterium]
MERTSDTTKEAAAGPGAATIADPWRPRADDWLRAAPSRYAGKPDRPLFIGGCRRSGTTLLRSMLDNHPDLAVPAETNFVLPLLRFRARYGDLRDPANRRALAEWIFDTEGHGGRRIRAGKVGREEAIARVVAAPPTLGSLFGALFAMYAEVHRKRRWGDKRPAYAGHVKSIFELFPDAQFVNVVRDPRGAVASQIAIGWYRTNIAVPASTVAWEVAVDRVDAFARRLRPDQLLDVRYEDMVRDPAATLERICAFAGLRGGDTIEQMVTAKRRGRFREGWHDRLAEPVTSAPIDSWRERLAPEAVALVEHATRSRFDRFGYRGQPDLQATPDPAALEQLEQQRRRARRPIAAESSRWP